MILSMRGSYWRILSRKENYNLIKFLNYHWLQYGGQEEKAGQLSVTVLHVRRGGGLTGTASVSISQVRGAVGVCGRTFSSLA